MPDRSSDSPVREPKQDRSRRTLERLLDATEQMLAELGVDGTTVPRIAERAGMSVGIVYRRFRDKDSLLRAVYDRFFERTGDSNRLALAPERWRGKSARAVIESVVGGMVRGHVQHRELLRALVLYSDTHDDPEFRRRVQQMNLAATAMVVVLLAERRNEIAHPEPEQASVFALTVVASALNRWVQPNAEPLFPYVDADALARELTAMTLRYLQIG